MAGQEKYKLSLEYHVVPESKEVSPKKDGNMSKGYRGKVEKVLTDQTWNTLSN